MQYYYMIHKVALVLVFSVSLVANLVLLGVFFNAPPHDRLEPSLADLSPHPPVFSALRPSLGTEEVHPSHQEIERDLKQKVVALNTRVRELSERVANLTSIATLPILHSPPPGVVPTPKSTVNIPFNSVPKSPHDKMCEANFGWGLVDSIRKGEVVICPRSRTSDPAKANGTSVQCYEHHGEFSLAGPSAFCDMTNVALDGRKILSGQKQGLAGEEGHLSFLPGALSSAPSPLGGGCDLSTLRKGLGALSFQGGYRQLFSSAGQGHAKQSDSQPCDSWIQEPVIALTRNEWAHLLFSSCELLNAFIAINLASLDPSKVRILLLDSHPKGPFFGFFRALSQGGEVLQAVDLLQLSKGGQKVCFRRLITSIPGYNSFILDKARGSGSECRSSPLLKAWRDTLLSSLGLLTEEPVFPPKVILISRRPYHQEGFTKSTIGRVIGNEDELAKIVKQKAGNRLDFEIVDLASLPLREQVQEMRQTSILIGMHGAGLVQSLFLPEDSMVIEIFPKLYSENHRDRNIARFLGHVYMSYELESEEDSVVHVNPQVFLEVLDYAMHIARGSFGGNIARCGFLHCQNEHAIPLVINHAP